MNRFSLQLLVIVFIIFSCKQPPGSIAKQFLNESKLNSQEFTIDPASDTMLISQSGIRIYIQKGTFTSSKNITIEFKEALDFESMLQAGLFTTAGDKLLSSAGMFYFNTREKLEIQKPIRLEVPASTALEGMQLYKGNVQDDGMIDWSDPSTITNIARETSLLGKALFENNCASCHLIEKDLTGPKLAGVTQRWKTRWEKIDAQIGERMPVADTGHVQNPLFEFTRSWASYLNRFEADMGYACCVTSSNPISMNMFPNLSDANFEAIYKYVDDETERLGLSGSELTNACDTCAGYWSEYVSLIMARKRLTIENGRSVEIERNNIPVSSGTAPAAGPALNESYKQTVMPVDKNADYYKISITTVGWFNLDIVLDERNNVQESKLLLQLQGVEAKQFQVFLAIPSFKVLAEGGYLKNGKALGFKYDDGTLPLPQNTAAFVFAMGEEKGRFYFAKKQFITRTNQTIQLEIESMSREAFESNLLSIQQTGMSLSVDTSLNHSGLKEIDAKLKGVVKDAPSKCNCPDFLK